MEIEHFSDGASHGPVAAFLSDTGRIGFVCRQDGAYWEGDLPQITAPGVTPDRDDVTDVDTNVDAGSPRARRRRSTAADGPPDGLMSMAEALTVFGQRMT